MLNGIFIVPNGTASEVIRSVHKVLWSKLILLGVNRLVGMFNFMLRAVHSNEMVLT